MSSGIFFFFQAEDGIRDHCVTGVQTCALPISHGGGVSMAAEKGAKTAVVWLLFTLPLSLLEGGVLSERPAAVKRSEERRVGKECRFRGWTGRCKKYEGELSKQLQDGTATRRRM